MSQATKGSTECSHWCSPRDCVINSNSNKWSTALQLRKGGVISGGRRNGGPVDGQVARGGGGEGAACTTPRKADSAKRGDKEERGAGRYSATAL